MFPLVFMLFLLWKAVWTEFMGLYNLHLHTPPCLNEIEKKKFPDHFPRINPDLNVLPSNLRRHTFMSQHKNQITRCKGSIWNNKLSNSMKNTIFLQRQMIFELVKIILPTMMPKWMAFHFLGKATQECWIQDCHGIAIQQPLGNSRDNSPCMPITKVP